MLPGRTLHLSLALFPALQGALPGLCPSSVTDICAYRATAATRNSAQIPKRRRVWISQLAKAHVPGTPCPRVEYTAVEKATWSAVYDRLTALYPSHACERFNEAFAKFGFSREVVPQLADCADVIHRETGWTIRPTAGLLHPRDFLAGLAFKTFHSTQYVRHGSKPMYTPEPDVVHEILGHVPMLADPDFASLIHAIGVASLGASKRDLWHLTKVYWYTVEFGLIREADRSLKAFGAGVLSSYGELEYSLTPQPEIRELDPYVVMPKIDYSGGFQKTYFVLESFDEGAQLLKEFAGFISRPGVDEVQVPDVAVHGYADSAEQDWGTGAQRWSVKNGKDAQRAAAARGGSDWEE